MDRRNELELASALLHKVADGTITAGDSLRAVTAAAAVDAILEPGGWTQIREEEGAFTTNLPLTTRASLRDALKTAAKQRRKTLTSVVTEGFRDVLAVNGTWTPPQPGKTGKIPAGDHRAVLNVTINDQLRRELRAALPQLSEELGYKVTEGGIAIAYLRHYFRSELAKLLPEKKTAAE